MPLPILGGIVMVALISASAVGTSLVSATSTAIDKKAKKKLKSSPNGIPRPPHGRGMTRAELKRAAQEKLNMDVTRYFNFAFCGACGAGKLNSYRR